MEKREEKRMQIANVNEMLHYISENLLGNKIAYIKLVKGITGLSLKESKHIVEKIIYERSLFQRRQLYLDYKPW